MFIHYGHKSFDISKFQPIRNDRDALYVNKPRGGLWASPLNSASGWRQWCNAEEYMKYSDDDCFRFKLIASARVAKIENLKDYEKLPVMSFDNPFFTHSSFFALNFEEIAKHYDAIFYKRCDELHYRSPMRTWDCDSLLVLNPDVVMPE